MLRTMRFEGPAAYRWLAAGRRCLGPMQPAPGSRCSEPQDHLHTTATHETLALALQAGGCYTPLQLACYTGHAIAVRALLACGADPTATASTLTTSSGIYNVSGGGGRGGGITAMGAAVGHLPLHLAARYGHAAAVEALLESGVDPNAGEDGLWWRLAPACAVQFSNCIFAVCRLYPSSPALPVRFLCSGRVCAVCPALRRRFRAPALCDRPGTLR